MKMNINIPETPKRTRILAGFMAFLILALTFQQAFVGWEGFKVKADAPTPGNGEIHSATINKTSMYTGRMNENKAVTGNSAYTYTGKYTNENKTTLFDYISDYEIDGTYNTCQQDESGYTDVFTHLNDAISNETVIIASAEDNNITIRYRSPRFASHSSETVYVELKDDSNTTGFPGKKMTYDSTAGYFTYTFTPDSGSYDFNLGFNPKYAVFSNGNSNYKTQQITLNSGSTLTKKKTYTVTEKIVFRYLGYGEGSQKYYIHLYNGGDNNGWRGPEMTGGDWVAPNAYTGKYNRIYDFVYDGSYSFKPTNVIISTNYYGYTGGTIQTYGYDFYSAPGTGDIAIRSGYQILAYQIKRNNGGQSDYNSCETSTFTDSRTNPTVDVTSGSQVLYGSRYSIPLYFGNFWKSNDASGYSDSNKPGTGSTHGPYNNFYWQANMGLKPYGTYGTASAQKLVGDNLSGDNGKDARGNLLDVNHKTYNANAALNDEVELPYFDKNSSLINDDYMRYYDTDTDGGDLTFPFYEVYKSVAGSSGEYARYYQFDSREANLKFNFGNIDDEDNHSGYFEETAVDILREYWDGENYIHGVQDGRSNVGFYPFNENNNGNQNTYNTSHTYSSNTNINAHNLGFGAKFEMDFQLEEDGRVYAMGLDSDGQLKAINTQTKIPVTFEFTGDDDLWVFIDGNLVLDMGGDHNKSHGVIDFYNKTATVDNAIVFGTSGTLNRGKDDLSTVPSAKSVTTTSTPDFISLLSGKNFTHDGGEFDNKYNPNETHTLTVFYMERGMMDSNLSIRYNYSPIANTSRMKIAEVTKFDNVNAGLKTATQMAAEGDVFKYTVTNTLPAGATAETPLPSGAEYPVTDTHVRTAEGNSSWKTTLTPNGTTSPATESLFVNGTAGTETYVKDTTYWWVDGFSDTDYLVGKTTPASGSYPGGDLWLMYGTSDILYGDSKRGVESSAEFEKQFTKNSVMKISQGSNLYRLNRAANGTATLFDNSGTLQATEQDGQSGRSSRAVADYYSTNYRIVDRAGNIVATNPTNGQFTFHNITSNPENDSTIHPVGEHLAVMLTEYVENTVKTGNLQITKNVSGSPEPAAGTEYTFQLVLTDVFGVAGNNVTDYSGITISGTGNNATTLTTNGEFTLKKGGTATITGIPVGTKYTVEETDKQGANTVTGEITTAKEMTTSGDSFTVTNTYTPQETEVTVRKTTSDNGNPEGAELDLYYRENTIPPAYIFNDPFVTPTRQITVTIPTKPTAPAVAPVTVTETTQKKNYSYSYTTEATPSVTPTSWILPRSDNDYIYFRDYNSGNPALSDNVSFAHPGSGNTSAAQNGKRSWLRTDLKNNEQTQKLEIDYDHRYWFEAQFSGPGKADVKYAIWERFVDRYNKNGKEQDTVVWKIQPPDGYNEVRFCMYDGGHCIRTTEKITFRLGEIYEKTDWGGIYKNEGVDCYFNVPLNDEAHNNWATHRTNSSADNADKRMTNFDSTNGASTMQQAERYVPTEQKVIFHCNSNQVWHNIHIEFFKLVGSTYQPVGQQFPGYMMEPYAYAGDNYRIGNYLTYELTIPEGATHFRVNNGVNSDPYNYRSGYTELHNATDRNGTKNYGNYFSINGDGNGHNVTSGTPVTLGDWNGYPSADERNKTYSTNAVDSDYDYIYFEAPNSWGSHIYAYFYGGGNLRDDNWQRACYSIWPGITPVGTEFTAGASSGSSGHSDIYDYPLTGSIANPDNTFADKNSGTTVYKFKVPLGERKNYSKVIFNNGLKSQVSSTSPADGKTHETGVITYSRGYLYKADGSAYQHYENKPTTQYEQRGDDLYIMVPSTHATGTNGKTWDDLHIKFYNSSGTQILQGGSGYLMQYSGVWDGYTYYTIPIPTDAKKFSLNNGKSGYSSSTGTKNDLSTGIYDIPRYDSSLNTSNVTAADVTKKDVVYKLTNTSLEQTSPKITLEEEVVNETTGTTFTPENPSPRGDHLYIRDAGNILSDIPTITFYEFADSSTAISTTLAAVKLEESPEGTDWYSIGIPTNASYFTMTYNNGTSNVTTAKTQIYAKSTGANQMNATPGDMYYDTTDSGLEITWPTFTSDADDLTDERYTDTSPYGQRGDNLYVVSGSALSDPKVIFYNSIGVPIVNAAGNSEISLKSLGQITAPASGAAPIDGKTSNDANAQGYWYRAAIPTDAASFAVKYGSTTTEQEKIYEKSSKIKRYSNDYTLDGMQYRINGTSATLLYPVFEEDPNYTLDAGGGQVINSNGSTVRVDTTKVADYANYGAATAEKVTNDPTPALYQTSTNDVTYQWGGDNYAYVRFADVYGWNSVASGRPLQAYFFGNGTKWVDAEPDTETYGESTTVYKFKIPTETQYPNLIITQLSHIKNLKESSNNGGK